MESRIRFLLVALVMFWTFGLGFVSCKAQTTAEFLRQNKTQEKYLLKQLAFLELYGSELRKGYAIAKEGLGTIKEFTAGEFNLHQVFFDRLTRVNRVIQEDFRLVEIVKLQLNIRLAFGALIVSSAADPTLHLYIQEVRKKVMEECDEDLNELLDIVLSVSVEMDDQARLGRLKLVHVAMKEKEAFSAYFCAEVQGMLLNRKGYKIDLEKIRRFYEK